MRSLWLIAVLCLAMQARAQEELTAEQLLDRSIAFHDPDGKWEDSKMTLVVDMEMPNRPVRSSQIIINNEKGTFELSMVNRGRYLQWKVDGLDSCEVKVDFREPTTAQADSLGLNSDRARRWRNYYSYLYGLPMKLKDEGTNIMEGVTSTTFEGKDVLAIKVMYDEAVGSDTWYFYFHPSTYAMVGYRFYHDESKNDGEYIVLEGMSIQKGLRIPKDRAWYTNGDKRLLGTDMLVSMDVEIYYK